MQLLSYTPGFDLASAERIAEASFGVRASARVLPSERDQNFLLTANNGERFVLKIANALESQSLLEAQNAMLDHLRERVSFCPRSVPNVRGESISTVDDHFVRLVTYLPGTPLAEATPHSPALLRDLGTKLGQLDRALADFDHPAAHRDFHWDLANGNRVIEQHAALIEDAALRDVVLQCRLELSTPLRRSVIHGDANDYNVLVEADSVVGLIDFGDIVHSWTAGNLAVALAYVVLGKDDPHAAAKHVIDAYNTEFPLLAEEREVLWQLVRLRLAMSVCLAVYQHSQRPENKYLQVSQRAIETTLPRLF
ncbi:MAG TPA: phosphotransferase [Pyrinomonadaceae bacterium]|nr:phosphotransferase [Pyrinomonadaceae bacterium]